MREILFRAKSLHFDKWIEGYYAKGDKDCIVSFGDAGIKWQAVKPETVGQFTGMTDQSGRKIFEGDLLKPFDDEFDKMVVEFHRGVFTLSIYGFRGTMMPYGWDETAGGYGLIECEPLNSYAPDVEVIGNIFDNPQPLRGGDCIG